MKKLLIVLAALMIPTVAMAGNLAPKLWLEVYYQADDPTDPEGPGFLTNPCVHPRPVHSAVLRAQTGVQLLHRSGPRRPA